VFLVIRQPAHVLMVVLMVVEGILKYSPI